MPHFRSIKVTLPELATIGGWGEQNHFEEVNRQANRGKRGCAGKIAVFAVLSLRLFSASLHYKAVSFLGLVLFAVQQITADGTVSSHRIVDWSLGLIGAR
jgi:hypothetical protein